MHRSKALFAALSVAAIAVPAHAADMERATFRLSAVVRTVCNVSFTGAAVQAANGMIDLGEFAELCNDRHGFRIVMTHGAELAGSDLLIGGRSIPLSASGQTVIVDENQPMERVQSVQLRVNGMLSEAPNIFLRIEPKGPRF